jgi:hypothetical protein
MLIIDKIIITPTTQMKNAMIFGTMALLLATTYGAKLTAKAAD